MLTPIEEVYEELEAFIDDYDIDTPTYIKLSKILAQLGELLPKDSLTYAAYKRGL